MGHKTLIDGVGYDITGGRCLDDGVGYSIQKGRTLVDGVGYDVAFGASGMAAGDLAVGSSVFANVNGVRTEFLVVHQGLPSSMYDASCDGTWLLMKNLYEKRIWHSSRSNSYKASTICTYLNGTFLNLFEDAIKAKIKTVKIPYVNGTGNSAVASGSNGLSTHVFLLSGYEVGMTNAFSSYIPQDGACLSYFIGTVETDSKRIGYLNGTATHWWLRSPNINSTANVWMVNIRGKQTDVPPTDPHGVRPAFVLDGDTAINPDTFDILG